MGDNREIGGFGARLTHIAAGGQRVALWQVDDLERYVDRHALLAAADAPEPPYWAHLWSGARVLADAVPRGRLHAVELGCGLGLPGLVAALHGARVTFVDRAAAALAFVRASAAANGVAVDAVAADVTSGAVRRAFDLVLLAEVLYDRAAFPAVARAIADHLAPGGLALLADGDPHRHACLLSRARRQSGLHVRTTRHPVVEEGVRETIALSAITWSAR